MKNILLILLSLTLLSCSKDMNKLPIDGIQDTTAENTEDAKQSDRENVTPEVVFLLCDKSPIVQKAILYSLQKDIPCSEIKKEDLLQITSFEGITYFKQRKIRSLKQGDFDGLSNLTVLDLSNNNLKTLPKGIFNDLNKLERIILSGNQLKALPEGIFKTTTKMEQVDLAQNKLQTIPEGTFSFKALPMLKRLYLQDNKFSGAYKDELEKRIETNREHLTLHPILDLFDLVFTPKFALQLNGSTYRNQIK